MAVLSLIMSIISVYFGICTISAVYKYFNWRINND